MRLSPPTEMVCIHCQMRVRGQSPKCYWADRKFVPTVTFHPQHIARRLDTNKWGISFAAGVIDLLRDVYLALSSFLSPRLVYRQQHLYPRCGRG